MRKLRILLADDHAVVRQGLRTLLREQPDMEVVAEAGNGEETLRLALETRADVVVLDMSMPGGNGAQATARLLRASPGVKVLALTFYEDEGYVQQLLNAGASGYVAKRTAPEELTAAIRAVASGGRYLSADMAEKLRRLAPTELPPSPDADLDARETELVRMIARGYSNREIAGRLRIDAGTVAGEKARVMEKLALRTRVDLVRYAQRRGWVPET